MISATKLVYSLRAGRSSRFILRVVPDGSLYRIEWPDSGSSDLANLTRCKDAAVQWAGRQVVTEGRKNPCARRLKSLKFFWTSSSYVAPNLQEAR